MAKSKMHCGWPLLTRLRQICCHPKLVGNDSASGKTETLFELLDPIPQSGNKILLFLQFVEMLKLLRRPAASGHPDAHPTGETGTARRSPMPSRRRAIPCLLLAARRRHRAEL